MEDEKDKPENTKKADLPANTNMLDVGSDSPNLNMEKVDKVFSE